MRQKRYIVGLTIPTLDDRGEALDRDLVCAWRQKTIDLLTDCFGGATVITSPGTSIVVDGEPEKGQTLVIAACDDRAAYKQHAPRLNGFLRELKAGLKQETALLLAFDSDSVLLEAGD